MHPTGSAYSLAVPLSQNTAEVHEFRCLFTHDVRRKAKRWQDGFLTFHTFNNRAIVFDESRHKVGDTYTKAGDALSEGDELTLQQGVLVEVGEPQSRRDQDVSQVIAARDTPRKPPAHAVYPSAQLRAPEPRLVANVGVSTPRAMQESAAPSAGNPPVQLQRPKSLKEVLKTPARSIGRAAMSAKSPYDQRHEHPTEARSMRPPARIPGMAEDTLQHGESHRPRKRQRIEGALDGSALRQDTRATTPEQSAQRRREAAHRDAVPVRPVRQPPVQRPGSRAASPIYLESDEDSVQHSPLVTTPVYQQEAALQLPDPPIPKSIPTRVASPSKPPPPKPRMKAPATEKNRIANQAVAAAPDDDGNVDAVQREPRKERRKQDTARKGQLAAETTSSSDPSAGVSREKSDSAAHKRQPIAKPLQERSANMLRLSSSGRKRKLLYRELLPGSHTSTTSKPASRSPKETKRASAESAQASSSSTASPSRRAREEPRRKQVPDDIDDFDDLDLSALVMPQQPPKPPAGAPRIPSAPIAASDPPAAVAVITPPTAPPSPPRDAPPTNPHLRGAVPANAPNPADAPDAADLSTSDLLAALSPASQLPSLLSQDHAIVSAQRAQPPGPARASSTTVPPPAAQPPAARTPDLRRRMARVPGLARPAAGPPLSAAVSVARPRDASVPEPPEPAAPEPPEPAGPAHLRSPLKRVASAPQQPRTKLQGGLVKSYSDLATGAAAGGERLGEGRGERLGAETALDADRRGPWSREAWDLFGWRPGEPKGAAER